MLKEDDDKTSRRCGCATKKGYDKEQMPGSRRKEIGERRERRGQRRALYLHRVCIRGYCFRLMRMRISSPYSAQ